MQRALEPVPPHCGLRLLMKLYSSGENLRQAQGLTARSFHRQNITRLPSTRLGWDQMIILLTKGRVRGLVLVLAMMYVGITCTMSFEINDCMQSLALLPPPHPRRQMSVATQLPTVPIPASPSEETWAVGGTGFMSSFEPVPMKPLVIHTFLW